MNLTYTSTDPNASGTVNVDLDVERTMRFRGGRIAQPRASSACSATPRSAT